jgi:uncharacterized protein YggE
MINRSWRWFMAAFLASVLAFTSLQPCQANTADAYDQTAIIVSGAEATVAVAPDQARINMAVVSFNKSLEKAQEENNLITRKVIAVLEDSNIQQEYIRTQNYSVYPQYRTPVYPTKEILPAEISGYEVRNELSVVVKDLSQLGHLLDRVLTAGVNNINYINFEKSNITEQENKALQQAVIRARQKADIIAGAAGMTLGKVLNITEGGIQHFQTMSPIYLDSIRPVASAVPINPGQLKVTARVTITYELK